MICWRCRARRDSGGGEAPTAASGPEAKGTRTGALISRRISASRLVDSASLGALACARRNRLLGSAVLGRAVQRACRGGRERISTRRGPSRSRAARRHAHARGAGRHNLLRRRAAPVLPRSRGRRGNCLSCARSRGGAPRRRSSKRDATALCGEAHDDGVVLLCGARERPRRAAAPRGGTGARGGRSARWGASGASRLGEGPRPSCEAPPELYASGSGNVNHTQNTSRSACDRGSSRFGARARSAAAAASSSAPAATRRRSRRRSDRRARAAKNRHPPRGRRLVRRRRAVERAAPGYGRTGARRRWTVDARERLRRGLPLALEPARPAATWAARPRRHPRRASPSLATPPRRSRRTLVDGSLRSGRDGDRRAPSSATPSATRRAGDPPHKLRRRDASRSSSRSRSLSTRSTLRALDGVDPETARSYFTSTSPPEDDPGLMERLRDLVRRHRPARRNGCLLQRRIDDGAGEPTDTRYSAAGARWARRGASISASSMSAFDRSARRARRPHRAPPT